MASHFHLRACALSAAPPEVVAPLILGCHRWTKSCASTASFWETKTLHHHRPVLHQPEPPQRDTGSQCSVGQRGSSFQLAVISDTGTRPEMEPRGNRRLIKMKLCNNTRIIHHHPSCICLQEAQITQVLIEILFYLCLNYLWTR